MKQKFSLQDIVNHTLNTFKQYDLRHVTKDYMNTLNKGAYGLVNLEKKKIYIRKDLKGGEHDGVLLHELAHIYYEEFRNEEMSESDVWELANVWLRIIYKNNK